MTNDKRYLVDSFVITAAFRYELGRKTAIVKHIVDMIIGIYIPRKIKKKNG